MPCESRPSTKKGMSVPIKTPVRYEKDFTLSIPGGHFANMTIHQKITRLSCDFGPCMRTVTQSLVTRAWCGSLEKERILREK